MKTLLIFISLSFFYSCSTLMAPTKEELSKLNYGPKPKNYRSIYISTLKGNLKDPNSLVLGFVKPPKKMWSQDIYNGLLSYWVICGTFDAKNSFGGYTGKEIGVIWYKNGKSGIIPLIHGEMMGAATQYRRPCSY